MQALFSHADIGLSMLLFFFAMFVGIAVWAYRPGNKSKLESFKYIPLEESVNEQR